MTPVDKNSGAVRGLLGSRHLVVKITDFTDFHPILRGFERYLRKLGRYFTPKRLQEPRLQELLVDENIDLDTAYLKAVIKEQETEYHRSMNCQPEHSSSANTKLAQQPNNAGARNEKLVKNIALSRRTHRYGRK